MPEHFTDALGNWRSRAKEVYRHSALQEAHAEFCQHLGELEHSDDAKEQPDGNLSWVSGDMEIPSAR